MGWSTLAEMRKACGRGWVEGSEGQGGDFAIRRKRLIDCKGKHDIFANMPEIKDSQLRRKE